jgi:hypothetical protein
MYELPSPEDYFRCNGLDAEFKRAGSRERQVDLLAQACEMLEIFRTPGSLIGSRLSNDWLGRHGWKVQIVPNIGYKQPGEELLQPLLPALRAVGVLKLLGASLYPSLPKLSPVWQFDGEEEEIDYFFHMHRSGFHVVWCEDRRFAIHGDPGNYDVYAGPEDLVRATLPPFLIGAAATRKNAEEIEWEHGPGCMDAILEHYAPFMLDND